MDIEKEKKNHTEWFKGDDPVAFSLVSSSQEYERDFLLSERTWLAAKAQAVPEGFVLVEIKDLRDVISNAGDAMMNEETSSVYDITGEPSTWFDHYTVAEKQVLKAIELQEQSK